MLLRLRSRANTLIIKKDVVTGMRGSLVKTAGLSFDRPVLVVGVLTFPRFTSHSILSVV